MAYPVEHFPAAVRALPRGPAVCPLPYGADLRRHVGGRDDRQQGRARGRRSLLAAALSALCVGGLRGVLSPRALVDRRRASRRRYAVRARSLAPGPAAAAVLAPG